MKKLLLLAIIVFSFSSCGKKEQEHSESSKKPMKIGLVFDIGGRGDKSFNDAAYKGLEEARSKLGIEFEAIDPGDGADRESSLRKLASKDDIGLVFGVGFIFTDDVNNIAKEFPDKKFACIDYSVDASKKIPDNVEAIEFREEEGSFLAGALAALTTKTNKVGFIGGMESPLIKKFENGFRQGVKYVKPDCEVLTAYVSVSPDGFKNPGKAKEIALSQYSGGADIVYHASGLSGLGLFEAAREQGKLAIGVDMDQQNEAPGFVLSSMVKQVDESVLRTADDFKQNKFKGGIRTFGLKENGVGIVLDENNKKFIPQQVKDKLGEIRSKIISGEIKLTTE